MSSLRFLAADPDAGANAQPHLRDSEDCEKRQHLRDSDAGANARPEPAAACAEASAAAAHVALVCALACLRRCALFRVLSPRFASALPPALPFSPSLGANPLPPSPAWRPTPPPPGLAGGIARAGPRQRSGRQGARGAAAPSRVG